MEVVSEKAPGTVTPEELPWPIHLVWTRPNKSTQSYAARVVNRHLLPYQSVWTEKADFVVKALDWDRRDLAQAVWYCASQGCVCKPAQLAQSGAGFGVLRTFENLVPKYPASHFPFCQWQQEFLLSRAFCLSCLPVCT